MRSFIAFVASAIRVAFRITWRVCRATSRLVMQMIPDIDAAPAQPAIQTRAASKRAPASAAKLQKDTSFEQVRELARKMSYGVARPEDMKGLKPAVIEWVTSLDREQLCRLVCAENLKAFIDGQASLKGMPGYLEPVARSAARRTVEPEPAYQPRMAMPI